MSHLCDSRTLYTSVAKAALCPIALLRGLGVTFPPLVRCRLSPQVPEGLPHWLGIPLTCPPPQLLSRQFPLVAIPPRHPEAISPVPQPFHPRKLLHLPALLPAPNPYFVSEPQPLSSATSLVPAPTIAPLLSMWAGWLFVTRALPPS